MSVERTGMMKVADCVNNVENSGKGTTGGIVGRIGDGLKLSAPESENRAPANVNSSNPVIKITK